MKLIQVYFIAKFLQTFHIFVMEASKEKKPVAKRTSKEDGPVAAKRRRIGNHDYQNLELKVDENFKQLIPSSLEAEQIIQEKQQIIEDLKVLQASKSKLQAQIQQIIEDHKVKN